jgi:8-amino-7-oxononanoate synthase
MSVDQGFGDSSIIQSQLDELKSKGLYRTRKTVETAQGGKIIVNGKSVLNFCSNDYLGLANHPALVKCFKLAADKYGVGSGASSLVCGRSTAHVELEEEVARVTGRDKTLLFSSGYLANLAIVCTLIQERGDSVFQDRLNHASMIDASLMSRAKLVRYPHCDLIALEASIAKNNSNRKLVLTDSIFSMDGDLAPLVDLAQLSCKYKAPLVVDDAHGFGVFGTHGAGVVNYLQLNQTEVPLMMATFGKSVGCAGAFIAGPDNLIELLVQKARPYIYSTAMAPAIAVAAKKGLQLIEKESWRQELLFKLIQRFRNGANQAGLLIQTSSSPIQPLIIGSAKRAIQLSDALLEKGFLVTAIRPPTVPANTSRLRITLSASHTESEVDQLLDALIECNAKINKESVEHA